MGVLCIVSYNCICIYWESTIISKLKFNLKKINDKQMQMQLQT